MEIRVLEYYMEVVRQRGITAAARTLHISQSTLSRQIKDLENELGVTLFNRGSRQITLTEEGYFLYDRAREILALASQTESSLTSGATLSGTLNVGAGENQANQYLMAAFNSLVADGQKVLINYESFNADQVTQAIERGTLDFGVVSSNEPLPQYNNLTLPFEDHWGIAFSAGSDLDSRSHVVAADLKGQKLMVPRQLDSSSQLLSYLDEYVEDYQIVATYDMQYNMQALVNAGMGLALTFDKPMFKYGNVHFRQLEYLQPVRSVMIWRKDRQLSRLAQAFLNEVRTQVHKGK